MILRLKVGGRVVSKPRGIKKEMVSSFKRLYNQPFLPDVYIQDDLLPRQLEEDVNGLETTPTMEEIKGVVWCCESSKSPRYDGYNFNFIKKM